MITLIVKIVLWIMGGISILYMLAEHIAYSTSHKRLRWLRKLFSKSFNKRVVKKAGTIGLSPLVVYPLMVRLSLDNSISEAFTEGGADNAIRKVHLIIDEVGKSLSNALSGKLRELTEKEKEMKEECHRTGLTPNEIRFINEHQKE